jgi:hypothetical protein
VLGFDSSGDGRLDSFDTNQDGRIDVSTARSKGVGLESSICDLKVRTIPGNIYARDRVQPRSFVFARRDP